MANFAAITQIRGKIHQAMTAQRTFPHKNSYL
jgi:hypothetical protein